MEELKNLTILYPLSPSHSGSTLLSLLMGAQQGIYSIGELFLFSDRPNHVKQKETLRCSCDQLPKEECPFWNEIITRLSNEHGIKLNNLNVECEDDVIFKKHNQYLFNALSEVSGRSVIVDASKLVSRFVRLRQAGFTVVPILLKRQAPAMVYSWVKRDHDWWEVARYYPDYYKEVAELVSDRQNLKVNYEELVQNPKRFLKCLLNHLSINDSSIETDWTKEKTHYLKGNSVKFQSHSTLAVSHEWKDKMTLKQKILTATLALPVKIDQPWFYNFWSKVCRLVFWFKY